MAPRVETGAEPVGAALVEPPVRLGRLLRQGLAVASLTAAAVHASAIAGHTFHSLHLLAFVVMTVFQAWWAYLILRSAAGAVLALGALGHGAILGLWLLSRTAGIPDFVPGGHAVEAVGLKDGIAALLALAIIAGIDALSRRDLAARLVRPSLAGRAAGAFAVTVVILGLAATLASGHVHAGGSGRAHHVDAESRP